MVDRSGTRALWRAGLRLGAARREGGQVPQAGWSTAGLCRGQAVHDAGQAFQTGGAKSFVIQTLWKNEKRFKH